MSALGASWSGCTWAGADTDAQPRNARVAALHLRPWLVQKKMPDGSIVEVPLAEYRSVRPAAVDGAAAPEIASSEMRP